MHRSLKHYWRINLAVIFSAAVATAVLTGALLVGDSVRGSLRDLTLNRLGKIDYALISQRYFREELVAGLASADGFGGRFSALASAIIVNGNAVHSRTKSRASKINIIGADAQFFSMFNGEQGQSAPVLRKQSGQIFPTVIINTALQKQLQAEIGDQILLSFARPSDIARGSLLGNKATEDVVESIRLTLTKIVPEEAAGRFSLQANQSLPLNAFISLHELQKVLEQESNVNAIFIASEPESGLRHTEWLNETFGALLSVRDLGIHLNEAANTFAIESDESILSQQLTNLSRNILDRMQAPYLPVYTYLANSMSSGDRQVPYSTIAAMPLPVDTVFGEFRLNSGEAVNALSADEIVLNTWAADDLKAVPGDTLRVSYFGVGPRDDLFTQHNVFKVTGVVTMHGLALDSSLTPNYPGISDVRNIADWDPPFPVDLSLIRPKDENYWDRYRSTPKAFVSLETGQKIWGSRFGEVTSIRVAPAPELGIGETLEFFEKELLQTISPDQVGFVFQPVKEHGLQASSGATDFSGLFVGFSLFLIVSAALLVGLLFRLAVEQRTHEIGMLLAVGYRVRKVRRRFMLEGGLLALLGSFLGLAGAVFYAWLMMVALRTLWLQAVGTPFLFLHVTALSLGLGFVISVIVIFLSIWLGFRKLSKVPPPALLAGVTSIGRDRGPSRAARITAFTSFALAVILTGISFTLESSSASGIFFGVGSLVLISGLSLFSLWLRSKQKSLSPASGMIRLASRNSPRSPGRSMLSAALVACACFVIVAVEAFRHDFGEEALAKDSGTGGFSLIAESDIPLHYDLSSEDGRFDLGFSDDDSEQLSESEIIPFRFRPGQDASCLNLYQVEKPRILGVTDEQIKRGGFRFQQVADRNAGTAEWDLLKQDLGPDIIPAFGDYNSVLWILHSGLGKDFEIADELGNKIKLRFVGLFQKSIFQSELLISEENFLKHFPSQSGYAYFLIQTAEGRVRQDAQILESALTDYGFDTVSAVDKLVSFQAVENTYLSTFQTLGGFGLLLGTVGLGIILIRNVIERRGELAAMRAFGYRHTVLALLVLAENGFLLFLGIAIGSVSAVIAVAPHVLSGASQVPWLSLLVTLVAVFLVGMLASLAAVRTAVRIPLLPALRAE